MKVVLLSYNEKIIKSISRDDVIIYENILKFMDNILEINPDVIVWDYTSYPKHFSVFFGYYKSLFNVNPNVILVVEDEIPVTSCPAEKFFYYEKIAINSYIESFNKDKIRLVNKIKKDYSNRTILPNLSSNSVIDILYTYTGELFMYSGTIQGSDTASNQDTTSQDGFILIPNSDVVVKTGKVSIKILRVRAINKDMTDGVKEIKENAKENINDKINENKLVQGYIVANKFTNRIFFEN